MNILILYGTTDGHTAKIAEFLRDELRAMGAQAHASDARDTDRDADPQRFDAVIVTASVHVSNFQSPVVKWIRKNLAAVSSRPSAFLPVCLGILQDSERVRADLDAIVARFTRQTGWQPAKIEFVAGAIPYSRYGLIKKWVMQYMSRQAGMKTSPSQDYEFTDWDGLRRFLVGFVADVER